MEIPDNYDEVIKPALARFCGWRRMAYEFADGWFACEYRPPDFVLEEGMRWATDEPVGKPGSVAEQLAEYYQPELPDPLRDPADAWRLLCALTWYTQTGGDTPELALVLAAWSVVQEMEKGGDG